MWQELRERKIVQWGLVYAAAALAVLEGVDILGDHFSWSEAIFRLAAIGAATGLLLILVLAWYHGEQGRQRFTRVEVLLLGAILVLGAGSGWLLRLPDPTGTQGHDAPARSVAVLPFDNVGGSADTEYFSDGVTQEIMNALAQVPGLWVAARTSSFAVRGENLPTGAIARQLGVRQLLEGTVRRTDDGTDERVRITVQLIDAGSGRILWSQAYDRLVSDIFAVQVDIASKVAQQLQLRTVLASDLAGRSTRHPEALDLYLRGLYEVNAELDYGTGRDLFRQAVALDSTFALGFAALAETYNQLDEPAQAEAAARTALVLAPNLPEARAALAFTLAFNDWRWPAAEAELNRALELNPNNVLAVQHLAYLYQATGRHDEAIAQIELAHRLDPLSLRVEIDRGLISRGARQYERAARQFERVLRRDPGNEFGRAQLAAALHESGRIDEAAAIWTSLGDSLNVALATGDSASVRSILESRETSAGDAGGIWAAAAYARVGEHDAALAILDSLYGRRYRLLYVISSDPGFHGLRGDPRFQELLRGLGLEPERERPVR